MARKNVEETTMTDHNAVIPAVTDATTSSVAPEKLKVLEVAFAQIDKQFGKGSVMLLGQKADNKIETVPTGSILIDQALGIGGLPRGRVVEIYGPEASGKTTLTLHAIAQAQKAGSFWHYRSISLMMTSN